VLLQRHSMAEIGGPYCRPKGGSVDDADRRLVDDLASVWESMARLGDELGEADWKAGTECPGWSVQDNYAHVIGIESLILGRPEPEHVAAEGPHVKNDLGRSNELWVDWFRARSGAEVLAEFRATIAERLAQLRDPAFDFGAETWTPVGPGTVRDQIPFRTFDSWIHEQDVRRAVGRPGGWESPGARVAMGRIRELLPLLVGKRAGAPDGSVVRFEVGAPAPFSVVIAVEGGRAREVGADGAPPTVTLRLGAEALLRLSSGRGAAEEIVERDVTFEGDDELGRRVATALNFLF
jgi:uncharacterized protein (TIGR03083 family)